MLNRLIKYIEAGDLHGLQEEAKGEARPNKLWVELIEGVDASWLVKLQGKSPTLLNIAILAGQADMTLHMLNQLEAKKVPLPDSVAALLAMQLCQPTLLSEKINALRVVLSHRLFAGHRICFPTKLSLLSFLDLKANLEDIYFMGVKDSATGQERFVLGKAMDCFKLVLRSTFESYEQKVEMLQDVIKHVIFSIQDEDRVASNQLPERGLQMILDCLANGLTQITYLVLDHHN